MNIITVIQARTASTRLPGKVLLPIEGRPLLIRMIERVKQSQLAGTIVVATTILPEDDIIQSLCTEFGINCFRGDPNDCLDRHYQAGLKYNADVVIKIPSDCPLIDPSIIDRVIGCFMESPDNWDYFSNLHPASYPDGNDVEVIPFHILKKAWLEASKPFEREHTTPYIWEHPELFHIGNVEWDCGLYYSLTHRWTIDYEEDYDFIYHVYKNLYSNNPDFGMYDILNLLQEKPELMKLNEMYAGEYWYINYLEELENIEEYKKALE